ncbi:hypothetical protein [Caballeronia sp. KNU42]
MSIFVRSNAENQIALTIATFNPAFLKSSELMAARARVVFEYRSVSWESAAQEAAFDDLCFCMLTDGRMINRHAMSEGIEHRNRYALPDGFIDNLLGSALQDKS